MFNCTTFCGSKTQTEIDQQKYILFNQEQAGGSFKNSNRNRPTEVYFVQSRAGRRKLQKINNLIDYLTFVLNYETFLSFF